MKKILAGLLIGLLSVVIVSPSAQAATYKLKLTVIQSDGVVSVYDDEDQTQKGANKKCMSGPLIINPEPFGVSDLIKKNLVQGGTQVKVFGSSGQTVGLGKISAATFVKTSEYEDDPEIGYVWEGYCKYTVTISIQGSNFYEIKVGKTPSVDVSKAALVKKKWAFTIRVSN